MAVAATVSDASGVQRTIARAPARRGPDIIPSQSIPLSAVSDQPVDDAPRPPVSASAHPDDQASGVSREISAEELALAEVAKRPTGVAPTSENNQAKPEGDDLATKVVDDTYDAEDLDSDKVDPKLPAYAQREITKTRNAARKARSEAQAAAEAAKAEAAAFKKQADEAAAEYVKLRAEAEELRARSVPQEETRPEPKPARNDFDDPDAYDEALTAWGKREGLREAEAEQKRVQAERDAEAKAAKDEADAKVAVEAQAKRDADIAKITTDWQAQVEAAKVKYQDFDQIATAQPDDGGPTVSESMAAAIMQVPNGTDVLYFLGKNTDESERIANIANPVRHFIEIGRISERLANPGRRSVPRPIVPLDTQRNGDGDNTPEAEPDMAAYAERRNAALAKDRRPFFPPSAVH